MCELENIQVLLKPDVRLTRYELARLFEVYISAINANIKALINSGMVMPDYNGTLEQIGKTVMPIYFGVDMVIALAFRIDSPAACQIRKFVLKRTTSKFQSLTPQLFISCKVWATIN